MGYSLQHHDLITVPSYPHRPPVICWLRLYRQRGASPECVAVLTEVPGNSGGSICNQHDVIADHLEQVFAVQFGSLALFHVWPTDLFETPSWTAIDLEDAPRATDTTRDAVERLVGEELADLPSHDDLYARVLD